MQPGSEPSDAGQGGSSPANQPGASGAGNPIRGGRAGRVDNVTAVPPAAPRGPDEANLEFTRQQVDLNLAHLKDQLAKEKSPLLEQLGWSRDEARRFLEAWRQRVASAQQAGPKGAAARKALDEAFISLGLRPHGTQLHGGHTAADQLQGLHDPAQFDPPGDWADLFRAYTRSTGGGNPGQPRTGGTP
jgi:hypothetical protein